MYIYKLPNAAASKISVTSTATGLIDLIETAASTSVSNLVQGANAFDITVEDGDIRMLMDTNTPTSTDGVLLSSGTVHRFRGVPLTQAKFIRVGGSNVACSIQVGKSDESETTNSDAFDVTLEVGSVEIGEVSGADLDDEAFTAGTDKGMVAMGFYDSTDDQVDDGDKGALKMTAKRRLETRSESFDTGTASDKAFEVSPISDHHSEVTLVDATNETDGTNYYYVDMDGYTRLGAQLEINGGSGTMTVTVEGTLQDDGTAQASCTYQDISTGEFGAASWTADAMLQGSDLMYKYIRFKTVSSTGGANDADITIYSKKAY